MTAKIVYALCALTSIGCAVLLLRSYMQSQARLLFWSGLCFVFLGLSNVVLFVDLVVVLEYDLTVYRTALAFIGVMMLLYGLIWETS
jgi:hypothetical protein